MPSTALVVIHANFYSDNPYDVLAVPKTASKKMIKRTYQILSMVWHPDRQTGNKESFAKITAAYNLLMDNVRRAMFDDIGRTDPEPSFGPKIEDYFITTMFNAFVKEERNPLGNAKKELAEKLDEVQEAVKLLKRKKKYIEREMVRFGHTHGLKTTKLYQKIEKAFEELDTALYTKYSEWIALRAVKPVIENYTFEEPEEPEINMGMGMTVTSAEGLAAFFNAHMRGRK